MTKEQFLSGAKFTVGVRSRRGSNTFSCSSDASYISRQMRSKVDERVVLDDYEGNIIRVTKVGFTILTFVMSKKVKVTYKFEDLVKFEEGA